MTFWQFLTNNKDILTIVLAAIALILSIMSTIVSLSSSNNQIQHNRMSLKPLPDFVYGNYVNQIIVAIKNKGLGPLRIEEFQVLSGNDLLGDNLVDLMPFTEDHIFWTDFIREIQGRVLGAGETLIILDLKSNTNNAAFIKFRNQVREKLKVLHVKVFYKGLYDKEPKCCERSLAWFGKSLDKKANISSI